MDETYAGIGRRRRRRRWVEAVEADDEEEQGEEVEEEEGMRVRMWMRMQKRTRMTNETDDEEE